MLDTDPVQLQRGRSVQPGGGSQRPGQTDQPAAGAEGPGREGQQRGEGITREGVGRVQNENSHLRFRGDFQTPILSSITELVIKG